MKYLIQFEKTGLLRYISHLDLMRLFQRTFKRAELKLEYSKGFNPHPKISIAQPLSLGYTSEEEYLEFETGENYEPDSMAAYLNTLFPEGISIRQCRRMEDLKKNAAASVRYGRYEIFWRTEPLENGAALLKRFLGQAEILAEKPQKKTKKLKEIDIRPMIYSAEYEGNCGGKECFSLVLATGSESNLNPELFMQAFCRFAERSFLKEAFRIHRKGLYLENGKSLINM